MSKTLIAVVVVLIVGGYFIFKNKGANNVPVINTEQSSTQQNTNTSAKKMAFGEFIKNGGSYKCEVKQNVSDMQNNGTVYISGSNMRGEFSTVAEGRTMQTSMITKDGYSYTWSSALPNMGFKTKIVTDNANPNANPSGNYSWNADQIGDYNCETWTVDDSKFTVPTNITFKMMGV